MRERFIQLAVRLHNYASFKVEGGYLEIQDGCLKVIQDSSEATHVYVYPLASIDSFRYMKDPEWVDGDVVDG